MLVSNGHDKLRNSICEHARTHSSFRKMNKIFLSNTIKQHTPSSFHRYEKLLKDPMKVIEVISFIYADTVSHQSLLNKIARRAKNLYGLKNFAQQPGKTSSLHS